MIFLADLTSSRLQADPFGILTLNHAPACDKFAVRRLSLIVPPFPAYAAIYKYI